MVAISWMKGDVAGFNIEVTLTVRRFESENANMIMVKHHWVDLGQNALDG